MTTRAISTRKGNLYRRVARPSFRKADDGAALNAATLHETIKGLAQALADAGDETAARLLAVYEEDGKGGADKDAKPKKEDADAVPEPKADKAARSRLRKRRPEEGEKVARAARKYADREGEDNAFQLEEDETMEEALWELDPDEQTGSVTEAGWHGLVLATLYDTDGETKLGEGFVLHEDTQGFKSYDGYDTEDDARAAWKEVERGQDEFDASIVKEPSNGFKQACLDYIAEHPDADAADIVGAIGARWGDKLEIGFSDAIENAMMDVAQEAVTEQGGEGGSGEEYEATARSSRRISRQLARSARIGKADKPTCDCRNIDDPVELQDEVTAALRAKDLKAEAKEFDAAATRIVLNNGDANAVRRLARKYVTIKTVAGGFRKGPAARSGKAPRKQGMCECVDPDCPTCKGECKRKATTTLYEMADLDDIGTNFCSGCSDYTMETGSYSPSYPGEEEEYEGAARARVRKQDDDGKVAVRGSLEIVASIHGSMLYGKTPAGEDIFLGQLGDGGEEDYAAEPGYDPNEDSDLAEAYGFEVIEAKAANGTMTKGSLAMDDEVVPGSLRVTETGKGFRLEGDSKNGGTVLVLDWNQGKEFKPGTLKLTDDKQNVRLVGEGNTGDEVILFESYYRAAAGDAMGKTLDAKIIALRHKVAVEPQPIIKRQYQKELDILEKRAGLGGNPDDAQPANGESLAKKE